MARRMFNALAEEPETVAAELVPRIRMIKVRVHSVAHQAHSPSHIGVPMRAEEWHELYHCSTA